MSPAQPQHRPGNIKATLYAQAPMSARLVEDHFRTSHRLISPNMNQNDYFCDHLYFFTASFHLDRIGGTKRHPSVLLDEFGKLYFAIAKRLIGTHLDRHRAYQPLTYAFIDFEGSRNSTSIDLSNVTMPHIHGLMLLRPEHLKLIQMMGLTYSARIEAPTIASFQLDKFDPSRGSFIDLISYCMKGYMKVPKHVQGRDDLWALFPR